MPRPATWRRISTRSDERHPRKPCVMLSRPEIEHLNRERSNVAELEAALRRTGAYIRRRACVDGTGLSADGSRAGRGRSYIGIALARPKRSAGNAFHWQPVRSTYTMPSTTCRAGLGGRPAPGLRTYSLLGDGMRCGTSGPTRCQNSSVTIHDSTRLGKVSLRRRAPCGSDRSFAYLRMTSKRSR
jgi:hypothetical protein